MKVTTPVLTNCELMTIFSGSGKRRLDKRGFQFSPSLNLPGLNCRIRAAGEMSALEYYPPQNSPR